MTDDFLEQFDPDDIEELQASAERIIGDQGVMYEMTIVFSAESAEQFVSMYMDASEGDIMAMASMMGMLHFLASSLDECIANGEED